MDKNNQVGIVTSALASNPYFSSILSSALKEEYKGGSKLLNGRIQGCKICGETHITLYKDGDSYICKDCKILRVLDDEEE